jgi:hypothetical protein
VGEAVSGRDAEGDAEGRQWENQSVRQSAPLKRSNSKIRNKDDRFSLNPYVWGGLATRLMHRSSN